MKLTTPVAILLGTGFGGLCIAVAVYAALRGRAAAPDVAAVDLPPAMPPAQQPRIVPSTDLATAGPSGANEALERAVLAQKPALVSGCWQPLASKPPLLGKAVYKVDFAFDATGHQATKAFLSPVGPMRLDLTECIARTMQPVVIPPLDAGVHLSARLVLP